MTTNDAQSTCFVIAANSAETPALVDVVARAGGTPIVMEDLAPRAGLLIDVLRDAISNADVVVGALSSSTPNDTTIFELGMAAAIGKPTIVLMPRTLSLPNWPAPTMTVRDAGPHYDGLGLALRQVLRGIAEGSIRSGRPPMRFPQPTLHAIGEVSDRLLDALDKVGERPSEIALVGILEQALAAGGANPVQGGPDARFDLGVWDSELEALVGNPLVIEVKSRLPDVDSTMRALAQVERYLAATGGRWALLVYGSGNDAMVRDVAWPRPVLTSKLRDLVIALRDRSFSHHVRSLRAERVHTSPTL